MAVWKATVDMPFNCEVATLLAMRRVAVVSIMMLVMFGEGYGSVVGGRQRDGFALRLLGRYYCTHWHPL